MLSKELKNALAEIETIEEKLQDLKNLIHLCAHVDETSTQITNPDQYSYRYYDHRKGCYCNPTIEIPIGSIWKRNLNYDWWTVTVLRVENGSRIIATLNNLPPHEKEEEEFYIRSFSEMYTRIGYPPRPHINKPKKRHP